MKTPALIAAALLLAAPAQAQEVSQVSGYTALIALGNARGVKPALSVASLQAVRVGTPAFAKLSASLRVSAPVLSALLQYGNAFAPTQLVTHAALESSTGKTFTTAAVAKLLAQNPKLAANTPNNLVSLIGNPAAFTSANKAADNAGKPVTPTSGGS